MPMRAIKSDILMKTTLFHHAMIVEGSKSELTELKNRIAQLIHVDSLDNCDDIVFVEKDGESTAPPPQAAREQVIQPQATKEPIASSNLPQNPPEAKKGPVISGKGPSLAITKNNQENQNKQPELPKSNTQTLAPVEDKPPKQTNKPNKPSQNAQDDLLPIMSVEEAKQKFKIELSANSKVDFNLYLPQSDYESVVNNFFNGKPSYSYKAGDLLVFYKNFASQKLITMKKPSRMELNDLIKITLELFRICSFDEKSLILDKFHQNVAQYLSYCCDTIPDISDIRKIPEFLPELWEKDYEIPAIEEFTKCEMKISIFRALFLVETFCASQKQEEKSNYFKRFLEEKCIYQLSIIQPLPVAFELSDDKQSVLLHFADISIASAEKIAAQVKFALGIFVINCIVVGLYNVDQQGFNCGQIYTFSRELGYSIIRTKLNCLENDIRCSYMIYCIPNKPGAAARETFKEALEEKFKEISVFECKKCVRLFSKGYGGECEFIEHSGERIPFENGQMEKSYPSPTGDVIMVKYSCCGEVEKGSFDDEGCTTISFDQHECEDNPTLSNMKTQVVDCTQL